MSPLVWFSLLAGTAPLLAATIPFYLFKNGINPRTFQTLLGLSAGLLFAIATLELIPEAFEMVELSSQSEPRIQSRDSRHLLFSHTLLSTDDDSTLNSPAGDTYDDAGDHEEGKSRVAMLGLGAGFVFLILLEQIMSGSGHSHSHSHTHVSKHDDEEVNFISRIPFLSLYINRRILKINRITPQDFHLLSQWLRILNAFSFSFILILSQFLF